MLQVMRRKADGKLYLVVDDPTNGISCLVPLVVRGGWACFELPLDEIYPGLLPIRHEDFEPYQD